MKNYKAIISHFNFQGDVTAVEPLGNGLINDTFVVRTASPVTPDYVLQRINHHIFKNMDALQRNIDAVTRHIRRKLTEAGVSDIDRRTLTFIPEKATGHSYWHDGENYWRMMVFIPDAHTLEAVTPETSFDAGKAFGNFQAMLVDIPDKLEETIPDFHNMEYRLQQLHEAVANDSAGRKDEVKEILDEIESHAYDMCHAERLYREGHLPKRICHCDTKVNNMMFDKDGKILCVIDLDTVMPSFIFSDYGDFLRTGACTAPEDEKDLTKVEFDMDIFRAFTRGYLSSAKTFLTTVEIGNLPYAAAMFPFMQAVRFLTDYINGDIYYKTAYPEHNLVRTKAQMKLFQSIRRHMQEMEEFISSTFAGES